VTDTEKSSPLQRKIYNQMVRRGLNGQKLAKTSQVSDSEISRILAGKSRPGLENAFRLARALGVSLDYLADDSLENDPAQPPDPLSGDERKILDLAHSIGCDHAVHVLENIRIIGYAVAMSRLLNAKPVIEVEESARVAPPAAPAAATAPPSSRANSA
jgi:transcriptional regulator with XRE-family HTH domain